MWAVIAVLGGCGRLAFDPSPATDSGTPECINCALCPASYGNFSGHRYRHETGELNWTDAQASCLGDQVIGSSAYTHLVVLSDAAEVGIIANFSSLNGNVWVGLSDRRQDGDFIGVTAEVTGGYPPAAGTPWDPGEPNGGITDDCVFETPTGTLRDSLCVGTYHFVCECDAYEDDPTRY